MERTILFADLAGFTALTEAHGDEDAADLAIEFHRLARGILPELAWLVKTIGDEVMIVCATPDVAIDVARRLVDELRVRGRMPALRIGIHCGPVQERDGDVFGATVNLAARVAALAQAGQVLCTAAVAAQADEESRCLGPIALKNIAVPVEIFELLPGEDCVEYTDPVCRMRVQPEAAAVTIRHQGREVYFCSSACADRFRALTGGAEP